MHGVARSTENGRSATARIWYESPFDWESLREAIRLIVYLFANSVCAEATPPLIRQVLGYDGAAVRNSAIVATDHCRLSPMAAWREQILRDGGVRD